MALLNSSMISDMSLGGLWSKQRGGRHHGVIVHDGPLGLAVGHTGGSWGSSSYLTLYPDSGYIVVVLSNYRTGASPLGGRIVQLLERMK
jgi:CubicO group peptidase (beta-lactamase class C family)